MYCGDADGGAGLPSVEADARTDDGLHVLLQTLIIRLMKLLKRRGGECKRERD